MFRRKASPPTVPLSHAERLEALGALLDERGFAPEGLSILASDEGYVVVGFTPRVGEDALHLDQRTFEVSKTMLAGALAQH